MHAGRDSDGKLLSSKQSDIEIIIEALKDERELPWVKGERENRERLDRMIADLTASKNNLSNDRVTGEFRSDGNFVRLCR